MKGYATSNDYRRLKELLDAGEEVVVLWEEDYDGFTVNRVAIADKWYNGQSVSYSIGSAYVGEDEFAQFAQTHGIEFFGPCREVDLEKEIAEAYGRFPEVSFPKFSRIAKHFYELGRKGGIQ